MAPLEAPCGIRHGLSGNARNGKDKLGVESKTRSLTSHGEEDSKGSKDHPVGCTPCVFYCFKRAGCGAGASCDFCHRMHISKHALRKLEWKRSRRGKFPLAHLASMSKLQEDVCPSLKNQEEVWGSSSSISSRSSSSSCSNSSSISSSPVDLVNGLHSIADCDLQVKDGVSFVTSKYSDCSRAMFDPLRPVYISLDPIDVVTIVKF